MAKKIKNAVPAAPVGETTTENNTPAAANGEQLAVTPKVKRTKKVKVEIPLTPAQVAAKAQLDAANRAAHEELIAQSGEKLVEYEANVTAAKEALAKAVAELKAMKKVIGIKGTFGGQKITTFFYLQDFPEGKGAPQARQILEIIKAAGNEGVARNKVVETMKAVINTKMDRSRLLSYYASRLVEAGVIRGA